MAEQALPPTAEALPARTSSGRGALCVTAGAVALAVLSLGVSLLILGAMLVTPDALRGIDFRIFYAAGWALRHGLDPYQGRSLARASVAAIGAGAGQTLGAFPYLPWVGWIMTPWSLLPYTPALVLWEVLSWSLVLGAARVWARNLGWRRAWPVAILASVSTTACLGYQVGQFDAMVVALLVATAVAAGRGHWTAAGLASIAAALLKPQVALPLAPLLWIFAVRERGSLRSVLAGQAIAVAVLLGGPSILDPGRTRAWLQLALHFSHGIGQGQLALVGLPGLVHLLPASWHPSAGPASLTTLGLVGAGLAAMVRVVSEPVRAGDTDRARAERAGGGLLLPLAIWLLVCPYVHPYDLVVLLPLLILTLGPDGVELRRPLPWVIVSALLLVPVVFPRIPVRGGTAAPLTSLMVLALVLFAVSRRGGHRRRDARNLGAPAAMAQRVEGCSPHSPASGGPPPSQPAPQRSAVAANRWPPT